MLNICDCPSFWIKDTVKKSGNAANKAQTVEEFQIQENIHTDKHQIQYDVNTVEYRSNNKIQASFHTKNVRQILKQLPDPPVNEQHVHIQRHTSSPECYPTQYTQSHDTKQDLQHILKRTHQINPGSIRQLQKARERCASAVF